MTGRVYQEAGSEDRQIEAANGLPVGNPADSTAGDHSWHRGQHGIATASPRMEALYLGAEGF